MTRRRLIFVSRLRSFFVRVASESSSGSLESLARPMPGTFSLEFLAFFSQNRLLMLRSAWGVSISEAGELDWVYADDGMLAELGRHCPKELPAESDGFGTADSGVGGIVALFPCHLHAGERMLLKVRETIGFRIESASSALEKSVKVFAGSRVCGEGGLLSNKECGQVWPFV